MAAREAGGGQQRPTRKAGETEETAPDGAAAEEAQERHDQLDEDVDDILDEIDDVLEENAEEFVRGYIQKGGE